MGVLTDLILGTKEQLATVGQDDVPINVLPGLDIKGTGLIELATLHSIVTGKEFDPGMKAFPAVSGEDSEDGPWVFGFPDELVAGLASATPEELSRIAGEWWRTEEIQMSGWPEADVLKRMHELKAFASRAAESRTPVHVWTSL